MNPDWLNQIPVEWEVGKDSHGEDVRNRYRNQGRRMERRLILKALEEEGEVLHIRTIKRIIEGEDK